MAKTRDTVKAFMLDPDHHIAEARSFPPLAGVFRPGEPTYDEDIGASHDEVLAAIKESGLPIVEVDAPARAERMVEGEPEMVTQTVDEPLGDTDKEE